MEFCGLVNIFRQPRVSTQDAASVERDDFRVPSVTHAPRKAHPGLG